MAVTERPRRAPTVALLDLDPDLATGLDPGMVGEARREIRVHVARIAAGDWRPRLAGGRAALGLLVVEGLLIRETRCGSIGSAELLGPGDVVRPWDETGDPDTGAPGTWFVLREARLALLDERATAALGEWPTLVAALFARSVRRTRALSTQRAYAQLRRLDQRTLLWLWHTAGRFGHVTPQGIALRLPLTHERLALLVGAHRPSLTAALIALESSGALIRGDGNGIVLTPVAQQMVAELSSELRTPRPARAARP